MPEAFETEIEIAAPPEEVFRHLVEPEAMTAWMGEFAQLDARSGGRFAVDITGVPVRGHYLVVDPPHRVVVSWGISGNDSFPPGASTVEFLLSPIPEGTLLRLAHADLPVDQVDQHRIGWAHYLPRLAASAAGYDPGVDPWAAGHG